MSILVPGCGSSSLSEHLYDAGFRNITDVDFSKVVISNMLRRNVRERPEMKWRVMDMTDMQVFSNLYSLQLEEDVNEVIFALKSDTPVEENKVSNDFAGKTTGAGETGMEPKYHRCLKIDQEANMKSWLLNAYPQFCFHKFVVVFGSTEVV